MGKIKIEVFEIYRIEINGYLEYFERLCDAMSVSKILKEKYNREDKFDVVVLHLKQNELCHDIHKSAEDYLKSILTYNEYIKLNK